MSQLYTDTNLAGAVPTSQSQSATQVEVATDLRNNQSEQIQSFDRRHDLDALRAIAMLLGIVLHAAISFTWIPWTVNDSRQSDWFYVLFAAIHGFRMPLFFLLSGFFTAMLWRKRGLSNLIIHRLKRIFLPLVLGCFTIIPAMWIVSIIASQPSPGAAEPPPFFAAVAAGNIEEVNVELANPNVELDTMDPSSGSTALCTAVFLGHTEVTEALIKAGADVNLANRDQATPLHVAAFMGRAKEAEMLITAGANPEIVDANHSTAKDLLKLDFGTTSFVAGSLGVAVNENELKDGRKRIANLLDTEDYLGSGQEGEQAANLAALYGLFFQLPVFMHLWFLAFLCWLVVAFVVYAPLANLVGLRNLPSWIVCSPLSLVWLIPLTMLPQAFMSGATFGPDPSVGLFPIPNVLLYYAVFFFFGAIYWDMADVSGRLGRRWFISLPIALLVVFPLALDLVSGTFGFVGEFQDPSVKSWAANFLQATFTWLMIFGSIGLFRWLVSSENKTLRYISDSSYWLYLAHLPLVILAQWLVRDWPIPAFIKFAAITVFVSAFLLVTYQYGVRYTWIGRLLNGPRVRGC